MHVVGMNHLVLRGQAPPRLGGRQGAGRHQVGQAALTELGRLGALRAEPAASGRASRRL
jgi:hypothetical protein